MIEIVLVRHAQPDWEPAGFAVDRPGLTDLGRAQSEAVATVLVQESFDHIYASPLRRVQETSEPILKALGQDAAILPWLRELELPSMEGQTEAKVLEFFSRSWLRDLEDWWTGLPGGESFRHFYERISGGIESLLIDEHRARIHLNTGHRIWQINPEHTQKILILAHEGTNAVILSHLLGVEPVPWAWMRFSTTWAGITRIKTKAVANGAVWVLEGFNRVDHMADLAQA